MYEEFFCRDRPALSSSEEAGIPADLSFSNVSSFGARPAASCRSEDSARLPLQHGRISQRRSRCVRFLGAFLSTAPRAVQGLSWQAGGAVGVGVWGLSLAARGSRGNARVLHHLPQPSQSTRPTLPRNGSGPSCGAGLGFPEQSRGMLKVGASPLSPGRIKSSAPPAVGSLLRCRCARQL